ncbi:MAG: hypothetical protein M3O73_02425 [Actinomycetota bacterium]|nr:hypothetical protein [Actinomycetota bacterium]
MLDDVFVIDAISHAYSFAPENRIGGSYPDNAAVCEEFIERSKSKGGRP